MLFKTFAKFSSKHFGRRHGLSCGRRFRRAGRKLAQCNYDDPASDEPGSPKSPKSPTASKQAVSRGASKESKVSA